MTIAHEPLPHERIWSLTTAVVVSKCLHTVAELGIADSIADEAVRVEELAVKRDVDPGALDRVMRRLATEGIFERSAAGYRHTPASELLRSEHPMTMRACARLWGTPGFTTTLANLAHSVRTGDPGVEAVDPRGLGAYLDDHPEESAIFAQAMSAKEAADIAAILGAADDFGRFARIAAVGGGRPRLLAAILDAAPGAEGILFDLPQVVEGLDIEHARLTPQAGDFFADPLPAADAYLLMEVLRDWADEEAVTILMAIRRAAERGARVLVIENVLLEGAADPRGQTLDVIMLAITGGRERTASELEGLLDRAGFGEPSVTETAGGLRIVEAVAA